MHGRFCIEPQRAAAAAVSCLLCLLGPGSAAADEIVTRTGDQLTGRVVAVGCDGLDVEYVGGQRLLIPLDAIATARTTSPLAVPLQSGDRLTGRLAIDAAAIRIDSPVLGMLALRGETLARLPAGRNPDPRPCAPTPAGAALKPNRPVAGDRTLAAISGTGAALTASAAGEPGTAAPVTDGTAPSPPGAASAAAAEEPPDGAEGEPLQFLRADAVLLQPYKLEGDLALSYLRNNQTVQNDKVASVTAALRFGLIEDMEGFAQVPYSWGRREINTFSGVERNDADGFGDVRFGLKYSVLPQSATVPNIIASLSASAPTGEAPYLKPPPGAPTTSLSRDIRDPFAVQLGTGHWSITPGLTAIKSFDPLILFASANYTHFFPEEYFGVNIEPGDLYDVNAGLGFAVNDSGTISGQIFAGYQEEWVFDGTHVAETSSSPISLRLAYTHILSPHDLIEPSVIFGLTGDANDAVLSLAYSHSF